MGLLEKTCYNKENTIKITYPNQFSMGNPNFLGPKAI
jgi:hypothetical protein